MPELRLRRSWFDSPVEEIPPITTNLISDINDL
jgi:hypothetical protein